MDLFGVTRQELVDSHQHHAASILALASILIEKGIMTEEEFEARRMQCIHVVEQQVAANTEKADQEFREENPEAAKGFDVLKKLLGE